MKKRILLVVSSIAALSILIGSFAGATDPLTTVSSQVNVEIRAINSNQPIDLVKIGDVLITNNDLQSLKAYKKLEEKPVPSDSELLKEIIIDELYLLKAKEEGVYVSLEDGKREAERLRAVLNAQPSNVQEVQKKILIAMGKSDDEYWSDFAPVEYQKLLSRQNLTNKLMETNVLDESLQYEDFSKKLQEYKNNMFNSEFNTKVQVLNHELVQVK
ncbi:hypothetical protein [Paenibacillus sp. 481]|uniref:hypothetical protein n=1 Tax=Paenibacillus sp. 481 TaxID=2835869 RepID=UPI001E5FCAF0|nr:hypothetical protein [Paenibacillus sp. 481]UHA75614.1 hypothetical protein KIK04_11835 [Paenibacillus sp. 481]